MTKNKHKVKSIHQEFTGLRYCVDTSLLKSISAIQRAITGASKGSEKLKRKQILTATINGLQKSEKKFMCLVYFLFPY